MGVPVEIRLCGLMGVWLTGFIALGSPVLGDTVNGRFAVITMDGSLAEWQGGDVVYNDAEIADGLPLNSTYSSISAVNDTDYLYIGLQLKAASSIFSNWTHTLYIDTDNNGATGFNAGWMAGGYDRLVQYGAGGGSYSVFSFAGANQWDWSWNFLGTIAYAFNDTVIEWGIPRSLLGGATSPRMEFHVGSGDVTAETWAMYVESGAKSYGMAATPQYTVTVSGGPGIALPTTGPHTYDYGVSVSPTVTEPAAANGTQYVSLGWSMTGHSPVSGSVTTFSMTVTNHATLTWLWQTNVQLTRAASGPGSISGDADGYYAKGATVNLTAAPDAGYVFRGWSGDVPSGQTNDNPLALTMDRKRTVTANFAAFNGRFTPITLDGSLADWTAGELFYTDAEISDGSPLNSTYSAVYVANDQAYVYIGMQLKGNSSILSNWMHSLFIDTDLNASTGYKAGWMNNGYNMLVQYGSGGGSYGVFAFSGGSQTDWSWSFADQIAYAFNGDVIEWAIPRSVLGGSTAMKLEFLTEGGDVGYGAGQTWAHHTEAQARIYTMSATPAYTVTVASAKGTASPSAGTHVYGYGSVITNMITEPAVANGTQYVSLGWSMTGHSPASGSATNFVMTVTNHATISWLWQTNVLLTRVSSGAGLISGDADGYYAKGATANLTAVPDPGYLFRGWSGDVPAGQTNDNPLALSMDRKRTVTANFAAFGGRFAPIVLDGSLMEWTAGDVFYTDAEIGEGEPLNSTFSAVYVANDQTYLYVGLQLKANSSILSNWTHTLFIDTDLNPATGFNSGWMSGGYDRLVQYGAGGGSYGVFSFGGGNQAAWSWNFADEIGYAYNGSVVEWAIPRSALGGSTAMKLECITENGSVTVQTWAHETEALARIYAMSATPTYTVTVASAKGTAAPAAGSHTYSYGTVITNVVTEPVAANGTQFVSLGWAMTGHSPASGSATSFTMTVTNHATLTWLWETNVWFSRSAGSGGGVSGDDAGYYPFGTVVGATATAASGYEFNEWSGAPSGDAGDNPLTLVLNRSYVITALFQRALGRYVSIAIDGSLADWTGGDVFYSDGEIVDGLPLSSTYSAISVANDSDYLYAGMRVKAPSSISSNWLHSLYIDTDLNPATGFNAGWMSGGYDRLVQYGGGGGTYSIYEFTGGSQAAWSWSFVDVIGYSFGGDIIEWAIPRTALDGSDEVKLTFHTGGGDVSVETWANATESDSKSYAFSTPNGCVPGLSPRMVRPSDQTVEANQLLSFTVTANDPGCIAPDLVIDGKPTAASFSASPSGTNQVGTFTWTPGLGNVGTHLLGFTAEDDQGFTTSFVMRVYVASPGESVNGSGVPLSQTNWAVSIADVQVPSSGTATVMWAAVSGVEYDIYKSTDAFGSGMNWTKIASSHEASASLEDTTVSVSGSRSFLQVVPEGASPTLHGVWGVIKPSVVPGGGVTLVSPPLETDLNFLGDLGDQMAASLSAGAKVMIMTPGVTPTWTELMLNGSGEWIKTSGLGDYTLEPGQAFFLQTAGAETSVSIAGAVGNDHTKQNSLSVGYNLIGISEGKILSASTAFESASPVGNTNNNETLSDQVVVQRPDGSWRRLIRRSNGTWYDTEHPNSTGNTSLLLTPGQAYYYIRRNSTTTLTF
jgi:hypothetical protein